MPKLTDIISDRETVAVDFGGALLRVTYRPKVVTPSFQRAVMAAQQTSDIDQALLWPLAELISSWDLTDESGEPVPTTPEAFASLPSIILLTVLRAITDDMTPNPTRGAASSNGSSQTVGSAPAPNGTSS